jgi:hypothetical protein
MFSADAIIRVSPAQFLNRRQYLLRAAQSVHYYREYVSQLAGLFLA